MVVDIMLPGGMNGIEFVDEARRRHPGSRVLYVSANPTNALMRKVHLKDCVELLQKPYRQADLLAKLEDIFA